MAMAKLQKTTLDVAKVSGRCGRLKCCLRYEHESYEMLARKLPRVNSYVRTTAGIGRVIDRQILTQLIKIRTQDEKVVVVGVEEVEEMNLPRPEPKAEEEPSRRPPRPGRERRPRQTETGSGNGGAASAGEADESSPLSEAGGAEGTAEDNSGEDSSRQTENREKQRRTGKSRRGRRRRRSGRPKAGGDGPTSD
jgi:hypothetical protein